MHGADVEQLLHLGTPESPVPRCTNNSVSMCEALHKHLVACGLFKPACAAPQSSRVAGMSSCAWEQHPPICVWAAQRKCFPCGLELVLGSHGVGLSPWALLCPKAGMQCSLAVHLLLLCNCSR